MKRFPDAIPLPDDVIKRREQRFYQVLKFALVGISIRSLIIAIELIGSYLTGSQALFSDAVSSFADLISTLFLILFVHLAKRPPDSNHPFGHGRYEPIGGMLLGVVLASMGLLMFGQLLFKQVQIESSSGHVDSYAWIFSLIVVCILEICYRRVHHIAKKEHSTALLADALHYRVDGITSLIATISLIIAAFFSYQSILIDYIGAYLISLTMVILGIYGSKENFDQLVDKSPDRKFFEMVEKAAKSVEGVQGTEKILIQFYGPDAHVDIDIEVDPFLSVDIAHRISQQVRTAIQKDWHAVRDVTVHIEPYYPNDH